MALTLCICARSATATAQSREQQDQVAREEFVQGREAFNRGQFEEAVGRFEHAYALSQRAQLLYNIGTSYDRLHRWQEAHDAFRRYLAGVPDALDRDEVVRRLALIDDEIERARQTQQNGGRPVIIVRAAPPRVIVRTEPPHPFRTVALGAGGLTLVGVAVTGTMALVSQAFYDGVVRDCQDTGMCATPAVLRDLDVRETFINGLIVATSIGAVITVVALVIDVATSRPAAASARASLAPRVFPWASTGTTPGAAHLGIAGSF